MGFALSDLTTIPIPALPVTLNNIPEMELARIQAGLRLYSVSMYVLLITPRSHCLMWICCRDYKGMVCALGDILGVEQREVYMLCGRFRVWKQFSLIVKCIALESSSLILGLPNFNV